MRIVAVEHAVPSRRIANEWILAKIREHNGARLSAGEGAALEAAVQRLLQVAGTQVRYQVNDGEQALDFALAAGRLALERSGFARGDIDFLIYAGVARGWIEPATAHVIQSELGLTRATCFDTVDACASWLRALHVAHTYCAPGSIPRDDRQL